MHLDFASIWCWPQGDLVVAMVCYLSLLPKCQWLWARMLWAKAGLPGSGMADLYPILLILAKVHLILANSTDCQ